MTNSMVEELPTPPPPLGTVDPWWKPLLRRRMLLIVAFMFVTMSFIRANAHGATKLSASFTVFTTLEFTMPILLAGLAGLERAQAAELALDRDADRMRDLAHPARDLDVVVVAGRRLRVLEQRAIHHHAGEPRADRLHAHRRRSAVVLVQHDRDPRV